jgi:hypothetical protein
VLKQKQTKKRNAIIIVYYLCNALSNGLPSGSNSFEPTMKDHIGSQKRIWETSTPFYHPPKTSIPPPPYFLVITIIIVADETALTNSNSTLVLLACPNDIYGSNSSDATNHYS